MERREMPDPLVLGRHATRDIGPTGTASAEPSMLVTSGDLYRLADLPRDEWSIEAVEAHAHSHGEKPRWSVYVYAAHKAELSLFRYEDRRQVLEANGGSIPVTEVLLHDVTLEDVIRCMKDFTVQLRWSNDELLVTHKADSPEVN